MSFAFPHFNSSPNFLAMISQSDVGSLSCQVMLQPVSIPLQHGLRFFRPPKPAQKPSANLTVRLPLLEAVQGFHVPLEEDLLG
jgi:hypothetical protein